MSERLDWYYHEPYGYLDSGVPSESSNYTTLIILHGFIWHAPVFRKLLPLASSSNTRVLIINRRGYPHSKPLSHTDTELLGRVDSSDGAKDNRAVLEGFENFMKARATELLQFISWLVDEGIVKPKAALANQNDKSRRVEGGCNTSSGGIAIIGWSGGNTILISILANLARFTSEIMDKLEPYMASFILYECPANTVMGYPLHPKHYIPLADMSLTFEQRIEAFSLWVSGYYHHRALPSLNSRDIDLDDLKLSDLDLEFCTPIPTTPPSVQAMSKEEITSSQAPNVAASEAQAEVLFLARASTSGFSEEQRRRAFFAEIPTTTSQETEGQRMKEIWPDLHTHLVWGEFSAAEVPYGVFLLSNEIEEARARGEWARNIGIVEIRGGNHYAHWDYPKRTFNAFLGCIERRQVSQTPVIYPTLKFKPLSHHTL